jgi:hypothetical protein
MQPIHAALVQTFGTKATDDVNRFFGTLDRQAKNAGVSAEIAERAFMSASSSLAMITNARPGQLGALTTTIMGGAPTAALGEARISGISGFLDSHDRYIEARMRKAGKLKKGEHLRDEQGLIRGDKMFDALEFVQGDLAKFYGTNDKRELVGRIGQSGMMAPQIAAGLVGLSVPQLREQAKVSANGVDFIGPHLATDQGRRESSNVEKDIKDRLFGSGMLPLQDMAVANGGGAAGIAIANAGSIFEKATGTFWNAVEIFAGAAGKGGAASAAAGAGAGSGAAGGAAGAASRGIFSRIAAAIGGTTLGLSTAALFLQGDKAAGEGGETAADLEAELAERKKNGGGRYSYAYGDDELKQRLAALRGSPAVPAVPAANAGQSQEPMMSEYRPSANQSTAPNSSLAPRDLADAIVKGLAGQTLRVQSVTPPQSPPGQPLPP